MPLPTRRIAAFCAVSIGILCWWTSHQQGETADHGLQSGRPRLLNQDLDFGVQPLGRPMERPTGIQSHFDPNVRPATATAALLASTAVGANGFKVERVSQAVNGQTLHWPVKSRGEVIRLASRDKVVLSGAGGTSGAVNLKVNGDDVDPPEATPEAPRTWAVEVTADQLGETTGETKVDVLHGGEGFSIFILVPTLDSQQLAEPTIAEVSNNTTAKPIARLDDPVNIYGNYLNLTGTSVAPGTRLDFAVFRTATPQASQAEFLGSATKASSIDPRRDHTWENELDLPSLPANTSGFVLVQAAMSIGGLHRYSSLSNRVNFNVIAGENRLEKPTDLVIAKSGAAGPNLVPEGNEFLHNEHKFVIKGQQAGVPNTDQDTRIVVLLDDVQQAIKDITVKDGAWSAELTVDRDGDFEIQAATLRGKLRGEVSDPIILRIRSTGPEVVSVVPATPDLEEIIVTFDRPVLLATGSTTIGQAFVLRDSNQARAAVVAKTTSGISDNIVTLQYSDVPPEVYTLTVVKGHIMDKFGNPMEEDSKTPLARPIGAETATISRGITGPAGPNVEFPEYTKPREFIDGFNPSDHVESRVSRLYYYRDAHRVAQIINRDVKSYNRAAVEMQQQLADKARTRAEQATDDRRAKERRAVEAAQQTRQAERELQQAEANAQRAASEAVNANAQLQRRLSVPDLADEERTQVAADHERILTSLEAVASQARRRAQEAFGKVQDLRRKESEATEAWQASIAIEDRARENQFRREVAAANVDPDTYAPGKPEAQDPVRQVSVSVIGEGLIQLRGPIKGINVIRMMINQMDAPVGQVRVGVHTVQINGEKGDRMERVAGKIQRYIDHSRFLSLQSAEMFRKAIVHVAAQKAMELGGIPGMTQEERDRKYLYSFFGEDFIRELEAMDSEFLHTGNKLLSIHSMDSTSLASAMFIMALAKNTTRMEILQIFEGMMVSALPIAEQNYFEAGFTCDGKERLFTKYCKRNEFQLLSQNARFQSIRGLFDAELIAADTMSPVQREFVRLAQIFKSRLIVEMELKQRIMERSVIEERAGDRQAELLAVRKKEDEANAKLAEAQKALVNGQKAALVAAQKISATLPKAKEAAKNAARDAEQYSYLLQQLLARTFGQPMPGAFAGIDQLVALGRSNLATARAREELDEFYVKEKNGFIEAKDIKQHERFAVRLRTLLGRVLSKSVELATDLNGRKNNQAILEAVRTAPLTLQGKWKDGNFVVTISARNDVDKKEGADLFESELVSAIRSAESISTIVSRYSYDEPHAKNLTAAGQILHSIKLNGGETLDHLLHAMEMFRLYESVAEHLAKQKLVAMIRDTDQISDDIGRHPAELNAAYQRWLSVERQVTDPNSIFGSEASDAFRKMLDAKVDYDFAARQAEAARRPLDHKKFLDMLVDEMEDKYIELLEGTRAHTANIDAYIKRLVTSLDDDFNTQFYYPTFRQVRQASQLYDVQMGQVETTNVLANNRSFAKVSPAATMEFDLPKRDILIAEAMDGAKAMIDDVGALTQDPTFLALAKMGSGGSTASQMNGASGGQSAVRNVLPGLSTDTAESVLGQQGPGGAQFGAAMEGLIPDPAIYKFETGTGWEIRPVIQPDGQAVVFDFNYMYTTNIREPVRADEKHLGRVKRHFVNTDVQLSNFELREISRYTVALKASRTSRGVPLFEDIPLVGVLFRPLASDESSLQQNIILGQATIFPTLFDLMGLRWAPVVADLDPLRLSNDEFVVRNRRRALMNRVFDHSSSEVDKFLRIPEAERRMDLYRSQETIPGQHPNGYFGPGANQRDSHLQEGYSPTDRGPTQYVPGSSKEGSPLLPRRNIMGPTLQGPEPEALPSYDPPGRTSMRHQPATREDVRSGFDRRFHQQWVQEENVQPESAMRTSARRVGSIMRLPAN